MQVKMLEPTSVDGVVKEPLSASEALAAMLTKGHQNASFLNTIGGITTRARATKCQLHLQLDSERKERQDLQSVVEELKQAKEQADADRIKHRQELLRMTEEHKGMKKSQEISTTLIGGMLAPVHLRYGTE